MAIKPTGLPTSFSYPDIDAPFAIAEGAAQFGGNQPGWNEEQESRKTDIEEHGHFFLAIIGSPRRLVTIDAAVISPRAVTVIFLFMRYSDISFVLRKAV